ncbi:MAG: FtsX-like permease family protein [Bdellovibrio sp.]|jgi:lipoprotein-releasing system permease protein
MTFDFLLRFLFSRRAGAVIRRISWLTLGGLTISVAALILVLSVMRALNERVQERTLATEPHLWVEVPGVSAQALETHPVAEKIKSKTAWRSFAEETQDVILRTMDGRFQGAVARGMTDEGLSVLLSQIESVGQKNKPSVIKPIPHPDDAMAQGEVFLGVDLAHSLGVFEGDPLMVLPPEGLLLPAGEAPKFEKVRVRRILTTNLADVDAKNLFFLRGKTLGALASSPSRHQGIVVWTNNASEVDAYKKDLQKLTGVQVQTWKERNSALFLALKLEKFVIGLFLGIAALVAGFSLLSVMGLLISQKRKELGLLQAIGLGPQAMRRLLVGIGVSLGGLGLVAGGLIGTTLSLSLEVWPLRVLPDIYYDAEIPASTDWFLIFVVLLIGFTLSYLGSFNVGAGLYKSSPSELLRNQSRS